MKDHLCHYITKQGLKYGCVYSVKAKCDFYSVKFSTVSYMIISILSKDISIL